MSSEPRTQLARALQAKADAFMRHGFEPKWLLVGATAYRELFDELSAAATLPFQAGQLERHPLDAQIAGMRVLFADSEDPQMMLVAWERDAALILC